MKMSIKTVLAAAALAVAVAGSADATLVTIGQANYNSSNYNLVYDKESSLIWLDYTHTSDTWLNQVDWASSLNTALTSVDYKLKDGYSVDWGTNSWRLPTTVDGRYNYSVNGTTTAGYNITNSEFGHLYYTELGNKGLYNTIGAYQPSYGLANKGDLTNLQSNGYYGYWSGTECLTSPEAAWYFDNTDGLQFITFENYSKLGLAVRSGQVSEVAPVPEPSTILLLGGGLAGLVLARRRKSRG
jgi:hypothetical protein